MTRLTGRQQFELALLDIEADDFPTDRVWDKERNCYSAAFLATQSRLVRYVRDEGIDPDDFGTRLRRELRDAHLAASLVKWAQGGMPAGSMGGQILTAAGVPYPIEDDEEPDEVTPNE